MLVKAYDTGQKGDAWLAIAPVEKNATPECAESLGPGGRVIEYPECGGYFKGAKGNLVFFNAADGTDGGLPFFIYDSTTGKKIFEDSAYDSTMRTKKVKDSPFNRLRVSKTQDSLGVSPIPAGGRCRV